MGANQWQVCLCSKGEVTACCARGLLVLRRSNTAPRGWLRSHWTIKGSSSQRLWRRCLWAWAAHHSGSLVMCRPQVMTFWPYFLTTAWTWRKPQETNWFQAAHLQSNITALKGRHDRCACACVRVVNLRDHAFSAQWISGLIWSSIWCCANIHLIGEQMVKGMAHVSYVWLHIHWKYTV